MGRVKFLAVIGVAALFLGACGNDTSKSGEGGSDKSDRKGEEQAYVEAMTASLMESGGDEETIPKESAECWSGDMVDGIGVDKLEEAGITPETVGGSGDEADFEKLSKDDRKVVADSFTKCIDLEQVFMNSLASSGEEIPQEMKECFEAIDWTVIEKSFSEMILTGEDMDENDPAMAPLLGCMLSGMGDLDMGDMDMDDMDTSTTVG